MCHGGFVGRISDIDPGNFQTIACTPYIGPNDEIPEMHKNALSRCCPNYDIKTWKITPPQTHKDYIVYAVLLLSLTIHYRDRQGY